MDERNLIRRPIANWIIRGLHSEFERVSTNLVSYDNNIIDKEETDETLIMSIEDLTNRYFLFSVKR